MNDLTTHNRSRRWQAPLVVTLLTALIGATYGFGIYLFAQLIPDMRNDLGFGYGYVGVATAAGQISYLFSALLAAWLTPRVGAAQVVIGCGVACAACLVLLPLTNSVSILTLLLVIMAGTASAAWVPMVAIVERSVPATRQGTALGVISAGTSYGIFINSLLVPALAPSGAWRSIWLVVGLGTLALTLAACLTFWLSGLLGSSKETQKPASTPPTQTSSASRLAALMAPWVVTIWLTTFFLGLATSPFQNFLSPYLRDELKFDIAFTAQVWSLMGVIGMFSGILVGWLADRLGLRIVILLMYGCILLAAVILLSAPSKPLVLAAGVLFSVAFNPIFGLVLAYISRLAPNTNVAVTIFGVANVTQGAGGMTGNYFTGTAASLSGTFLWGYAAIAASAAAMALLLSRLPKVTAGRSASS